MQFKYDEAKLEELILYVADKLQADPAGGAIKLNKVLFFAEFAHVRTHGRPITGAEYQRLRLGPAPRRLRPVRARLIEQGRAELLDESYLGFPQHRLVPTGPVSPWLLGKDELEMVDQVLFELRGLTGTAVSDLSHQELGWEMVQEGETIPYEAAFLRRGTPTPRAAAWARSLVEQQRR